MQRAQPFTDLMEQSSDIVKGEHLPQFLGFRTDVLELMHEVNDKRHRNEVRLFRPWHAMGVTKGAREKLVQRLCLIEAVVSKLQGKLREDTVRQVKAAVVRVKVIRIVQIHQPRHVYVTRGSDRATCGGRGGHRTPFRQAKSGRCDWSSTHSTIKMLVLRPGLSCSHRTKICTSLTSLFVSKLRY